MAKITKDTILTDGQKLRIINDSNKLCKKWNKLGREGKMYVLSGMEIATDFKWVLNLMEEATGEDIHTT